VGCLRLAVGIMVALARGSELDLKQVVALLLG
jgi:hypothetical protein